VCRGAMQTSDRRGVIQWFGGELARLTPGQSWTIVLAIGAMALFLAAGLPTARVIDDDTITGSLDGGSASTGVPEVEATVPPVAPAVDLPAPQLGPRTDDDFDLGPPRDDLPGRPAPGGGERPPPPPEDDECEDAEGEEALLCVLDGVPLPPIP
jgi:hypothetical protein